MMTSAKHFFLTSVVVLQLPLSMFAMDIGIQQQVTYSIVSVMNNLAYYPTLSNVSLSSLYAWSNVTAFLGQNVISTQDPSDGWKASYQHWTEDYSKTGFILQNFRFDEIDPDMSNGKCFNEHVTVGEAVASQIKDSEIAKFLASSPSSRDLLQTQILNNWYAHANCLSTDFCPDNFALAVTNLQEDDDRNIVFVTTVVILRAQHIGLSSSESTSRLSTGTGPIVDDHKYDITILQTGTFTAVENPAVFTSDVLSTIRSRLKTETPEALQSVSSIAEFTFIGDEVPIPASVHCSPGGNGPGDDDDNLPSTATGSGKSVFQMISLAFAIALS